MSTPTNWTLFRQSHAGQGLSMEELSKMYRATVNVRTRRRSRCAGKNMTACQTPGKNCQWIKASRPHKRRTSSKTITRRAHCRTTTRRRSSLRSAHVLRRVQQPQPFRPVQRFQHQQVHEPQRFQHQQVHEPQRFQHQQVHEPQRFQHQQVHERKKSKFAPQVRERRFKLGNRPVSPDIMNRINELRTFNVSKQIPVQRKINLTQGGGSLGSFYNTAKTNVRGAFSKLKTNFEHW